MKYTVLVTGAGSGGAENLINSIKQSSLDVRIIGTNMYEKYIAKSKADKFYILPPALKDKYIENLNKIIEKEHIDLVIPNNDLEVEVISSKRKYIRSKLFLPKHEEILICHDKYKFNKLMQENEIPIAKTWEIESFNDIKEFMEQYPDEKYWIRPKQGSGSRGATWVKTLDQAISWIKLWTELRDYKISDFTISEFLPFRDYAVQSIWKNGKLQVIKGAERLEYIYARNRLSNMSSSPSYAKTIHDKKLFDLAIKIVNTISSKPHGNYCLDLKEDRDHNICITEINIGRFFMITPIFDLSGKINTAEVYLKSALIDDYYNKTPFDEKETFYLIRELDTLPTVIDEKTYKRLINNSKIS